MMNAKIEWSAQRQKTALKKAQASIDKKCILYMEPYTPFRNGIMQKSVTLGTKIGSGHIVYNSPYARYQYYGVVYGPNIPIYVNGVQEGSYSRRGVKKKPTDRRLQYSKDRHPQATRLWFEVMKKKHGAAILRGVAELIGGSEK